jgi:hypothetical protein
MNMNPDQLTREIQAVVETEPTVWFLELSYKEGDIGHAVGSVYSEPAQWLAGVVPSQVLATNDSLSTLWASTSGAIWVASMSGHVATTASVNWPTAKNILYRSNDPLAPWTVTALPPVRATGIPPNITALWGIDDKHVFVGTYSGHIYFWNDVQWIQVYEGPGEGQGTIKAFAGIRADNVFAVGQNGTLLHFNGSVWRQISVVGDANGRENFTGIHAFPNGEFIISANGSQGRLLHGSSTGLIELMRSSIQLIDLVAIGERIIMATGDGVAELFGKDIKMVKSNFLTASAWSGRGRAFFIEPAQTKPSFVEHDPRSDIRPWWRHVY